MKLNRIVMVIVCILILVAMVTAFETGRRTAAEGTSPSEAICDPELFPIRDLDTTYTYACIDTTHARACRLSDADINDNFEIPSGHPLLARCSTTSTTSPTTTTVSVSTCLDPSSSKKSQLDCVWNRISNFLDLETNKVNRIWDNGWKSWNEVYAPPIVNVIGEITNNKVQEELNKGTYNQAFLTKVQQISSELNIDPLHLLAVMRFETGGSFDPTIKNQAGSGAVGLIQFLPSTAQDLGTTTNALTRMNRLQQLDYVKKYFVKTNTVFGPIRPNNLGDVAMAVFYPLAIGRNEGFVVLKEGDNGFETNKGLDINNDKKITRWEYIQPVVKASR